MKRFDRLRSTSAYGVAVLLIGTVVSAWGVGLTLRWEDVFDSGPYDSATWGAMDVVGNRLFVGGYAAGATGNPGDFTDIVVRAYGAGNGRMLWDDRFDLAGGNDTVLGLSTGVGRVFVTGDATDAAGISVPVLRVHSSLTGRLLWQAVADHQGLLDSAVADGSRVFAIGVVGEDDPPAPGASFLFRSDWLVRAYDLHSGRLLWQDRFGAPDPTGAVQLDRPLTVAAARGRVFVGGLGHASPLETPTWHVRAYDGRTGVLLWQDQVPGRFSQANALTVVGPHVIAAGGWAGPSVPINQNWLVRSYDAGTGALVWEDVVDTGVSLQEEARAVTASGGRVFVAGVAGASCRVFPVTPLNCDALLRAYDVESGALLWEDRLDSGAALDEYFSVAARGPAVYAVGRGGNDCDGSGLPTNCDGLIRAYDARSGHLVWEDRLNQSDTDDEAWAVAIQGPRLFVSGTTYDGSAAFFSNLVVRAYGALGGDDRADPHDHDDRNDRD